MPFQPRTGGQRPTTPVSTTVPDIINWPIQKRKMWHGKGHLPPWIEVRRVARGAVDDGLETHSLEELVDVVTQPCREAGLKAARNKRDEDAQVKREYHNMVMDLLQRKCTLVNDTRGTQQSKSPPNSCLAKANTRSLEDLHVELKVQERAYGKVEAPKQPVINIPQHTGFYASFFNGFFAPSFLQAPAQEESGSLGASKDEGLGSVSPMIEGHKPAPVKESPDDILKGWVDVENELDPKHGLA
ncbi:uncharacterized protein B0H64DRAFT_371799 [Chaetomium fimeti]|uniref:Uncharacterized protein n=1 Tax=Chaetomium fimeti TaxID=1854472 RepID=A0AAE0HMU8_9PEZI|nr:hypothetical protein B0H64DRAFT_371799 [Chaetomium fimeti]